MTKREMSEIFAVLLLAYPNAEVFRGGMAKLGPTINLWTASLPDVDYWIGQQAAMQLVRECKYPPTIAEFRDKAESVREELQGKITRAWDYLRLDVLSGKTPQEAVAKYPAGTMIPRTVAAMGGVQWLTKEAAKKTGNAAFTAAYENVLRKRTALPDTPKQIGGNHDD